MSELIQTKCDGVTVRKDCTVESAVHKRESFVGVLTCRCTFYCMVCWCGYNQTDNQYSRVSRVYLQTHFSLPFLQINVLQAKKKFEILDAVSIVSPNAKYTQTHALLPP